MTPATLPFCLSRWPLTSGIAAPPGPTSPAYGSLHVAGSEETRCHELLQSGRFCFFSDGHDSRAANLQTPDATWPGFKSQGGSEEERVDSYRPLMICKLSCECSGAISACFSSSVYSRVVPKWTVCGNWLHLVSSGEDWTTALHPVRCKCLQSRLADIYLIHQNSNHFAIFLLLRSTL